MKREIMIDVMLDQGYLRACKSRKGHAHFGDVGDQADFVRRIVNLAQCYQGAYRVRCS